jgi:hypothetical protein
MQNSRDDYVPPDSINDLDTDDVAKKIKDLAPGRELVKLCAHKTHSEIVRQQNMAMKKQKNEGLPRHSGEYSQSLAQRRKDQRDRATELCVMPSVVGLPKGLTLRDDPIKKSNVFLTAMPKLS